MLSAQKMESEKRVQNPTQTHDVHFRINAPGKGMIASFLCNPGYGLDNRINWAM